MIQTGLRNFGLPLALMISVAGLGALPLEEVTLFTSGVGEFVHRGTVEGSGTLSIPVPESQMSDVLRSLTMIDRDGGTIEVVTYASGEDRSTRLRRFSVDLSDTHRLEDVLRQFRGSAVEVLITTLGFDGDLQATDRRLEGVTGTTTAVSGSILGATGESVLLALEGRLREIPLWQVESVAFEDRHAQQAFDAAFTALTEMSLESDVRDLVIRYRGSGSRTLEVRYLQEMPLWHTTYRAVFEPGTRDALLQGWAHLDNTSTVDWDEVQLTLVSAQPVTYRFDLYQPRYVNRPRFGDAAQTMPTPPRPAAEAMMMRSMDMASVAEAVTPDLATDQLLTGITFTLPDPVTIPRGRSVMVPLVNRMVPAELTRQFDARRDDRYPRAAIRLTNDDDRQLPPGPVTVYERSRYVGDGSMPLLIPAMDVVVTYARDPNLQITADADAASEELSTVRIIDGVLVADRRSRRTTTYRIHGPEGVVPGRGTTAPLVIAHTMQNGWDLVSPGNVEVVDGVARITVSSLTATVVEERIRSQQYALTRISDDALASFTSNRLINPAVRRTLQNITTLRETLANATRTRQQLETRRDAIFSDQQRIATNMAQLDRNSSLYRRYASDLNRQEDELRMLRDDLEDARRDEEQARSALQEYLRTLGAE